MAFKPYCNQCSTWHTEKEGHRTNDQISALADRETVNTTERRNRGYYINSLRTWREEMISDQRKNIARLLRMEHMKHPDAPDQKALIDLQDRFIGLISEAEGFAL